MILALVLAGAVAAAQQDSTPSPVIAAGPRSVPVAFGALAVTGDTTPPRGRRTIEISDAYATRLKIHDVASDVTIPIFAAQAIVGEQLFHNEQNGHPSSPSLRNVHHAIAVTLGALFVTNTVTGSMNWWETRRNEKGRTWRTIHAALMLLSDAGFAYTASLGERARFNARGDNVSRSVHAQWSATSAGMALLSYIMMWKPIRRD